ncbi:MAG: YqaJ viral recombinase family protein [Rhodoferax sp.]|jgi:putative phage-type endonuclease|uniref:lambda-exonuclease family protein n=1 Tax=Rhodoferax sp. TaxID=50421 RepID=UPI001B6BC0D1|nr:YqaJ viral recombinase family protein [Rhodoferax sp.]MBP9149215.1 YqaJ viral recombinase family protein [Rhodoferax sp.]MBP9736166.1 YqaJ viral recombinase family protein [Rhodoferax sp.]
MELHNLTQGTPQWHAHRLTHFNASDAPAMMGCSPYKTRSQLLHEMHTGLVPEVDAATQRRFDDGHRFEELARPLAEDIIGDDLYPVVGSLQRLSASFDGLTMDRKVSFEHKSLNADLRECMEGEDESNRLALQYRVQMEQQLLVAGAEKCLFMASKWNGEELVEERHCWYASDPKLRQRIIDGWLQFAADLADYTPPVAEVKAVAAPQFGLPAVSIQVNGSIALIDNLQVFGAALTAYIERINRKPKTDQDFADLEATVKTLKNAEDALDAAESGALAQTDSIDSMRRTVAMYRETARTNRLLIDKLVKVEKESRKLAIVSEAAADLVSHIKALNARIGSSLMPAITSDFPGAVKGLKSIDSMRDKVATELARCKIEANGIAGNITDNLRTIDAHPDHAFLFADAAQLVLKEPEFVVMAIKNRVADHQAKEAARIAAETARIAEQERIKAEAVARARADAEIAAATAKARAEAHAQVAADAAAKRASNEAIAKAQAISESNSALAHVVIAPTAIPFETVQKPIALEVVALEVLGPPTLKLGQIAERLGFTLTADFLKQLGFEPAAIDKSALLFHEQDFPLICQALIEHIETICEGVTA